MHRQRRDDRKRDLRLGRFKVNKNRLAAIQKKSHRILASNYYLISGAEYMTTRKDRQA